MTTRYFYNVISGNVVTSVYRLILDDEKEELYDEKWTPSGWVDSDSKIAAHLFRGEGDLEEVDEATIRKYNPEIFEEQETWDC